jgi:hypothetical protein
MEQLALKYNASRVTIRSALQDLAAEGLVTIRQGKGTVPNPLAHRTRRREPLPNAADNFKYWKSAVKLPEGFPRLRALRWSEMPPTGEEERWYMGIPHQKCVSEILSTAATSANLNPQTVVFVTRGHGCTTLFRFIYKNLRSEQGKGPIMANYIPAISTIGKVIPIRVTWRRLGESLESMQSGLENSIRWDAIRELTTSRWESILDVESYARLIGAIRPGVRRPDIKTHLAGVREIFPEEDLNAEDSPLPKIPWDTLSELIPAIAAAPIPEVIAAISALDVKVFLMFDLSMGTSNPDGSRSDEDYSQRLSHLVGLIKDFHEHMDQSNPTAYLAAVPGPNAPQRSIPHGEPLFSEMYFLDRDIQAKIRGIYNRTPNELIYPSYEQIDIFSLLSRHYPPLIKLEAQGGVARALNTADLPAVLRSSFLFDVQRDLSKEAKGFRDCSIYQIVALLEQKLLQHFDRYWSDIPLHITV